MMGPSSSEVQQVIKYKDGIYQTPYPEIKVVLSRTAEPFPMARAGVYWAPDEEPNEKVLIVEVQKMGGRPARASVVGDLSCLSSGSAEMISQALGYAASFARKLDRGE